MMIPLMSAESLAWATASALVSAMAPSDVMDGWWPPCQREAGAKWRPGGAMCGCVNTNDAVMTREILVKGLCCLQGRIYIG